MAITPSKIRDLNARIDALVERLAPRPPSVCIPCPAAFGAEGEAAVMEAHFEKHPQDRGAQLIVIRRIFCEDIARKRFGDALFDRYATEPVASEGHWPATV